MLKKVACIVVMTFVVYVGSETVVGESAPFTFPGVVGTSGKYMTLKSSWSLKSHLLKNGKIRFSWSIAADIRKGNLSIYTPSGKLIEKLKIVPNRSFTTWDAKKAGISSGVYFAVMKVDGFKQEIKFSIL